MAEAVDEVLGEVENRLRDRFAEEIEKTSIIGDTAIVRVKPPKLVKILTFLAEDAACRFSQLSDLCAVDYPVRTPRFEVVYNLLSVVLNRRIRVKTGCEEGESVPSVHSVYPNAVWYEREAWDLFGIAFADCPDLRRILNDYGFEGHPLRKDFPLSGYVEVRYQEDKKKVAYERVKLSQNWRNFDFLSPWEGYGGGKPPLLPGDEKAEK